jgi:magnesium-transporting ATPase (P-type)
MYNTLFTFFPVMAVGIFNQGLTADALLHAPELYTLGSQGQAFNLKIFWRWQLLGLVEGFACCLIPFAFYGSSFRGDVDSPQLYALGITIYTTVVLVVTTKIGLLCYNRWTWINLTACVVTIALFFSYQVIYSYTFPSSGSALGYYVRGVFQVLGKSWMFWLVVGITVSIVLLAQIILQTIKNSFMPSKLVTYQIWEKSGVLPQATELGLREEALCLE